MHKKGKFKVLWLFNSVLLLQRSPKNTLERTQTGMFGIQGKKIFFAICENQEELLLQISISDNVGRFVMSTRDLRPGEIILKEKALILAPLHFNFNVCLGCNDTQSSLCKRY